MVLATSSPVFQNILKRNKHAHPLLYMRGMKSEDLLAILDFLYCGETNVYQEDLDSFLAIAEELQLKGLMGKTDQEDEISTKPSEVPVAKNAALKDETRITKSSPRGSVIDSHVRTVSVANEHPALIQNLDEQINTFMIKSSRKNKHGQPFYVCMFAQKREFKASEKPHRGEPLGRDFIPL